MGTKLRGIAGIERRDRVIFHSLFYQQANYRIVRYHRPKHVEFDQRKEMVSSWRAQRKIRILIGPSLEEVYHSLYLSSSQLAGRVCTSQLMDGEVQVGLFAFAIGGSISPYITAVCLWFASHALP